MAVKPSRIKSLKVGTANGDYFVTAEVDSPSMGMQYLHHSCPATSSWEKDFNDLLMTVLREARDLS